MIESIEMSFKLSVRDRDWGQSGFTLFELLITLVIVLLLSLFAIPLFTQSARRSGIQNDAIALATSLEIAESLASAGQNAQLQITQFRIRFSTATNTYIPEMYDASGSPVVGWVAAPAISSTPIGFGNGVTYGSGSITVSPSGQPAGSPSQATEIRFNTRGFPAELGANTTKVPRGNNAVYLTDGRNNYAVTVNLLGRVQAWYYSGNQWFSVSR